MRKIRRLRILAISDTHRSLRKEQEKIIAEERNNCDIVVTLGDVPFECLCEIQPDYGVLGNHDSYGLLGTWDIHGKKVDINGFTIAGLGGSSRYKEGNFPLHTQEESLTLDIPKADILLSHDCIFLNRHDDAHTGLKGITQYLDKYKPILQLHGHHHKQEVYKYNETTVVSVYKCAIINIEGNEVTVKELFN